MHSPCAYMAEAAKGWPHIYGGVCGAQGEWGVGGGVCGLCASLEELSRPTSVWLCSSPPACARGTNQSLARFHLQRDPRRRGGKIARGWLPCLLQGPLLVVGLVAACVDVLHCCSNGAVESQLRGAD